jgi:hypothetical protein
MGPHLLNDANARELVAAPVLIGGVNNDRVDLGPLLGPGEGFGMAE